MLLINKGVIVSRHILGQTSKARVSHELRLSSEWMDVLFTSSLRQPSTDLMIALRHVKTKQSIFCPTDIKNTGVASRNVGGACHLVLHQH